MDQQYTQSLTVEINKQKSKVDELIQKYRELARAKASASISSQRYIGKHTYGGTVKAGLPYLIGENFKPEMFVPSVSGSVVPVNNYNQSKSINVSVGTIVANNPEDFRDTMQRNIGDYT